jgi:hypothetical protein
MLSERDIELAHPEAFDFVWGNLPAAIRPDFDRHLGGCRYCQAVVDEYSEIGRIIKDLPPQVEPSAGLEDRTVTAMVAALAGPRATADGRPDGADPAATQVYPVSEVHRLAEPQAQVLPLWRRHRGRLAAAVAAAAVIVAAIVVPLSAGGGGTTVVIPLHATTAARVLGISGAAGQAIAHQAGASWTFDLTVHGLKQLPDDEFYECWWAAPGSTQLHPVLATGGSFVVDRSGSASLTMTTGVDPTQKFRLMEITVEAAGNGAVTGMALLIS